MADPRFVGQAQRRRMGAESSHLGMAERPHSAQEGLEASKKLNAELKAKGPAKLPPIGLVRDRTEV